MMKELYVCVVMPTYNNAGTLGAVIDSCLRFTESLIVVNDGSTDATGDILEKYSDGRIEVVSYPQNRGKGYALKKGFERAIFRGFRYAITIDSDGQHFAEDIPLFVQTIADNPDALVIGSRNIEADNMPGGNTFANKFSNFWFRVQTLQSLPDTQTGFRLYPLSKVGFLRWMTSRYEAELWMLVLSAWHGVKLIPIPVKVYYPPSGERVSHFKPTKDFFRISMLNVLLCILAIVYGGPMMLYNKMKKGKHE